MSRRYSSSIFESVEPFKTYYILCEGSVTEPEYFDKLSQSQNLNIRQNVKIIVFERQGESDVGRTDPISLRNFLICYINEHGRDSDAEYVMVFDADVIGAKSGYDNFIKETIVKYKIRPIVTSPCIELWFILHKENSLIDSIKPNENEILRNKKISRMHTFTSKMCSDIWKSNPKKCVSLYMVENVQIAINQAQKIETDIMF